MKKVLIAIAAVLILFFVAVLLMPADYTIERSVTINATPEQVFPHLVSTRKADDWGPWREEDPKAQMSYSGPEEGVGSKSSWTGGEKLGTGSATIVNVVPNERVDVKLEYQAPMNMTQDAYYILKSEDGKTHMTWGVKGKNNFMGRAMCIFMNMDKMVGSFFEKGLNKLKSIVEQPSPAV